MNTNWAEVDAPDDCVGGVPFDAGRRVCSMLHNMLQSGMVSSTDLYILLGTLLSEKNTATLRELAATLHVDHTLVHRALKRAENAGLYRVSARQVNLANFEELAIHAARFIAPARLGELTRGVPAAWAAEPISAIIHQRESELPPVWPSALGAVRGQALEPLHPAAVQASQEEQALARLLSIIDSLRAGDVRVREVAATALRDTLRRVDEPSHQTVA
jgi:hypothetical protein